MLRNCTWLLPQFFSDVSSYLAASVGVILHCVWSPLILKAKLISRGITVTLLACTANELTSSNSPVRKFSVAS